jgi:NADPH:quinone reductase-like Zn-dependent oxidoreductase
MKVFYSWLRLSCTVGVLVAMASTASSALPKSMRAAAIDHPGGPAVLTIHTLPLPQLGAKDVLIAVHTAGVSVWDADVRQRLMYVSKPNFPLVMGTDGAGLVAAVGSTVTAFKVGDAVYGHCWDNASGGFYAEYAAVPATCVARVPKGVSIDSAGALAASGLTALPGIDGVLRVRSGERLIIHGASGAVGAFRGSRSLSARYRVGAEAAARNHHCGLRRHIGT